ncbi:WAT1-related protein At1g68170 [Coffea arabica]|uniref:WAT1-related protein n=1 Tax=Coffea arabica TaxID=13443 RepID=A0A6P6VUW7_COFAR|nr:WAT1-related protein At1g68170-like [Coffea arabica]
MMTVARFCNRLHGMKPTMMMVMVQVALAGVNIFYKLAANDGMSMRIMVAYRFMFAAAAVVPLALYFERNSRPKLTWMVLFEAFLCAFFGGSLAQNLYAQSLILTSATFASATTNLIPALTFIIAVFFRLEKFELKTKAGKAKVTGTLICLGGAMLLTFYKGAEINLWSTHLGLLHENNRLHAGHLAASHQNSRNHILGPLLAISSSFSAALSLIFQAKMSERYPCHYSSTALICLMGSLQTVIFALCVENNRWSEWKLGWNIRLLAVSYSGTVASGIMITVTMWCVRMRGPLFVSVFSPLMLILVAIAGSLFLDEKLHLGSVLGAFVIIVGLYSVLWGKGKEMKRISQLMPTCDKTDEQIEMTAEPDKNAKSCSMMALGVSPNFLPTSETEALDTDPEVHLEEAISTPDGKA